MAEKFYLFQFDNNRTYEMTCGVSFKDALWEMAKYTGNGSELLCKSLKGFTEDDVTGMIDIFECLTTARIQNVYIIDKKIYNWNEREKEEK